MQKIKASAVVIQITGWLLFIGFPLLFLNRAQVNGNLFSLLSNKYYWEFCICYFVLFYLNSLYLIPFFFLKRKYLSYFSLIFCLLCLVYYLEPFDKLLTRNQISVANTENKPGIVDGQPMHHDFREPPPGPRDKNFHGDYRRPTDEEFGQPPGGFSSPEPGSDGVQRGNHVDFTGLFIFIMIVALSISIEITQEWRLTEQRAMLAETGKANAELSFLKARINPHFLFNTLNNIYTLAVTNNEHTADSIMKLSNIMRYVTDEVIQDFVPLQNELDCIDNYIELQRLRIGEKTNIDFSISGDPENKNIAPLIIMPFVENMFKHGISKQKEYTLQIKITIEKNSILLFCRNPLLSNKESANRKGIGISNTKQRLEQIYLRKYLLNISNENELYTVNLTLHT